MKFGDRVALLRREKDIKREELGKKVGTSGAIIGGYERSDVVPSVEVAAKIAEVLEVSLDYLMGMAETPVKDKTMLFRLELLEKISSEDKATILKVMDSFLKDAQLSNTQSRLG